MNCIFCRTGTNREPREHVIPEGLVGHRPFEIKFGSIIANPKQVLVLDHDEVCGSCNNKLGRLDEYLQEQFGFLRTYWNPVGTKSGRPATSQRPGMYAEARLNGPHIVLNMENRPISSDGLKVLPAKNQDLAVTVKNFKVAGRTATLTIQQPVRMNKRFMRGLHKIAFELLCFQEGPELVLDSIFDPIRQYIRLGRGSRTMVLTQSAETGAWEEPLFMLRRDPAWPGWLATIRLASTFLIDLSPDNIFFAKATKDSLSASNLIKWSDKNGGKPV